MLIKQIKKIHIANNNDNDEDIIDIVVYLRFYAYASNKNVMARFFSSFLLALLSIIQLCAHAFNDDADLILNIFFFFNLS